MMCCKCMWLQIRKNAAIHVMSWLETSFRCLPRGLRSELSQRMTDCHPQLTHCTYSKRQSVCSYTPGNGCLKWYLVGVTAVTDGRRKITARSNYRLSRRLSKFCLMSLVVSAYESTTVTVSVRTLTPCVLWRTLFVSLDLRTFCRLQDLC